MSGPLALRPYQKTALTNLWNWFSAGKRDCLVVLPTGAGNRVQIGNLKAPTLEVDDE